MNKSPAFQFYPDKWQSHTRRLSDSAYRVYHEVICWMWQHSPDQYSICKDADGIACALAMQPHTICKAIEEIQNPHAPLLKDEGERYISNGLKKEAEKQIENRQKKSKNAHARWDMQKQSGCNAVASIPQCSLIPSLIPSPSPITTTNKEVNSIGGVSVPAIAETKPKKQPFKAPSIEECLEYASKISMSESDTHSFFNNKEANGWMQGHSKMKCWKAGMRYWKGNGFNKTQSHSKPAHQQTSTFHSTGDEYLKSKGLI